QFLDGQWQSGAEAEEVRNSFDDALVGSIVSGSRQDAADAVSAASAALEIPFPAHERYRVLMRTADLVEAATEQLAKVLAQEGSKTITEARREPPRAADILRLAADASRRVAGETLPFDARKGSENRAGYFMRVPVGVVAAILPFNDPLAVAAHKVGPALAAGNAVVLKPDSRTPFAPMRLVEFFREAGLPPGRLGFVTGAGEVVGDALVRDNRVRLVSFTGGLGTGEKITQNAGVKKLILELGSNSAVLVMDDADLDKAVPSIVAGAYAQAGQNCLGVQRVLVHRDVYASFRTRLLAEVATLKSGHSLDPHTEVCGMIRLSEAERVEAWIHEAVAGGAKLLAGGTRHGAVIEPAVLEDVPAGCRMDCEEVYGPVLGLYSIDSIEEGIARTNAVGYGLHAAVFTQRIADAFKAINQLHVGGVIINDSTDYRLDSMPFGGVKGSGIGREGIEAAVHSMTEERVVCFNL
ncbi:MAG: glyceraldehyde-3-phosphate dehydrogenase (NADP+), partial [Thalassolituus oleivorans]